MYGSLVLIDKSGKIQKAQRTYVGDVKGKDEAGLRDVLFANPGIIPTEEIHSSFGPLVPLQRASY